MENMENKTLEEILIECGFDYNLVNLAKELNCQIVVLNHDENSHLDAPTLESGDWNIATLRLNWAQGGAPLFRAVGELNWSRDDGTYTFDGLTVSSEDPLICKSANVEWNINAKSYKGVDFLNYGYLFLAWQSVPNGGTGVDWKTIELQQQLVKLWVSMV